MFLRVAIFTFVVLAAGLLAVDAAFRNPFEVYENYVEAKRTGDLAEAVFLADRLMQQDVHSKSITQSDRLRLKAELADTFAEAGEVIQAEKLYTEVLQENNLNVLAGAGDGGPAGYDTIDRAAFRLKLARLKMQQKQAAGAAEVLHKLGDDVTEATPSAFNQKIIFTQMTPVIADFTKFLEQADLSDDDLIGHILAIQEFLDRHGQIEASTALKAHLLGYLKSDESRIMDYVRALQDLAKYNLKLGDLDRAQTYIEDAIAQLSETFDRQSVMLLPALAIEGQINNARGKPRKTTDRLEEALELVELYGDPDMPGAVDVVQTLKVAYELRGKSRKSDRLEREYTWMIGMGPVHNSEQGVTVETEDEDGIWRTAGMSRVYYWSRRAKAGETQAHILFAPEPNNEPGDEPQAAAGLWTGRADVLVYEQSPPPGEGVDVASDETDDEEQRLDLTTSFIDSRYNIEIRDVIREQENIILQRIKAQAGEKSGVLLMVHDAANGFKDAVRMSAYLRHRTGFDGPVILLDWPARDNRFGYRLDSAAIETVAPDLRQLFEILRTELPDKPISVLTIGAGAKAVFAALAAGQDKTQEDLVSDRAVTDRLILWGPDVSHRVLKRAVAGTSAFKGAVTLYQLHQSASLLLSRRMNVEFPAGDAASGVPKSDRIDIVRGYAPGLIDAAAGATARDDLLVYDLKRLLTETTDIRDRCGLRPVYGKRVEYWIVRHKECARITIEEKQPLSDSQDVGADGATSDSMMIGGQPES